MKPFILLICILGCCLLLATCGSDEEEAPNYEEQEQKIIDNLVPQLLGTWELSKLSISFVSDWRQQEAGIVSDTTFEKVGVLMVDECQNVAIPRYPECRGTLTYQAVSISIQFRLLSASERVVVGVGPYAFFLFEFDPTDLPDDYNWDQPEINFFRDINLIDENFAIDRIDADSMIWSGLNASSRGLNSVLFKRLE